MAVIATVAGSDSNSYLDVADADALAASELGKMARAWKSATSEDKEAALIRATNEIDQYVGSGFNPYAIGQALRFPRWDDVVYGTSTPLIPLTVSRATFLQAAYLLANVDELDDAAQRRARGLVNFANPDGTGGQLATERDFGRLHPRVEALLGDTVGGAIIATIIPT